MTIKYTKLGTLLLRIQAVVLIAQSIPAVAMAIPALSHSNEWAEAGIPNYALSILAQPLVGLLLLFLGEWISRKVVGHLDYENGA